MRQVWCFHAQSPPTLVCRQLFFNSPRRAVTFTFKSQSRIQLVMYITYSVVGIMKRLRLTFVLFEFQAESQELLLRIFMLMGYFYETRKDWNWPKIGFFPKNLFHCHTVLYTYFRIMKNSLISTFQFLGIGLNDSPIGLMSYVLEKFSTWTNPSYVHEADGGLEK